MGAVRYCTVFGRHRVNVASTILFNSRKMAQIFSNHRVAISRRQHDIAGD